MPTLSPTTLTHDEQRVILRTTAKRLRDHLIISMAGDIREVVLLSGGNKSFVNYVDYLAD